MGHQMNIKTAVGAALLGIFWSSSMAFAFDTASKAPFGQSRQNFAREFGKTLPPVGFVQFCVTNPADCKGKGGKKFKLAMSPEHWNLIYQVNTYVNGKIAPVSDQDLYGEPERWVYPTDAGDCEDYLLLKKLPGRTWPSARGSADHRGSRREKRGPRGAYRHHRWRRLHSR
jgi:predicted transglutaminase-like cysteine proteinase